MILQVIDLAAAGFSVLDVHPFDVSFQIGTRQPSFGGIAGR